MDVGIFLMENVSEKASMCDLLLLGILLYVWGDIFPREGRGSGGRRFVGDINTPRSLFHLPCARETCEVCIHEREGIKKTRTSVDTEKREGETLTDRWREGGSTIKNLFSLFPR